MSLSFALFHEVTLQPGQGWPEFNRVVPPEGWAEVRHDGKRYLYNLADFEADGDLIGDFVHWVQNYGFADECDRGRLSGTWPVFYID